MMLEPIKDPFPAVATKKAPYESLIFPAEAKDKFIADLMNAVRRMSPNGEGIFPGRIHSESPVPHHTLSPKPHYIDDQTGRVSQAEAVALESLWRETNGLGSGFGSTSANIITHFEPHYRKIFNVSQFAKNEELAMNAYFGIKGMDWFYQEILTATFTREVLLGELRTLIDLHKSDFSNPNSFVGKRLELFKVALKKDNLVIGKNVVKAAASFGLDWEKQFLQKQGPEYEWQMKYKKQWDKPLEKGFNLGTKLYLQVLDYAESQGLMTKFKTGVSGQVLPQALLK